MDGLISTVREGANAVLVIGGEAGVGKTALLEYAAREADGFRVIRVAGVEAESRLVYAGLHQLWAPMLGQIRSLPEPQAAAISVALGRETGDPPDRFLVALATLSLLTAAAQDRPLMCVIDDAQWLDDGSMQVVGFVARRLAAGRVGVVCALREPCDRRDLSGLPGLRVEGLAPADADALLSSLIPGPIDPGVRDRIIDETGGNPSALCELVRASAAAELAGGFALPDAVTGPAHVEREAVRLLDALPHETRLFLVLAAADPVGEPELIRRGTAHLGISQEAAVAAVDVGLIAFDSKVRFKHSLVRSRVYRSASRYERQAVHRALARATDSGTDPDRRAWHLALATVEPDEDVAAQLERCAGQAGRRGGLAAMAAFLERAAALTPERSSRARRMLAAADAKRGAGAVDAAAHLVSAIAPESLDELGRVRLDALRGLIAADRRAGPEAARVLGAAALRLEPLAVPLARQTYLEALHAAMWVGERGGADGLEAVARAALAAPSPTSEPATVDLLLDGFSRRVVGGYGAASGPLSQSLQRILAESLPTDGDGQRRWLTAAGSAVTAAMELWDAPAWHALATRYEQLARDTGAVAHQQIAIPMLAWSHVVRGQLNEALHLVCENRVRAATVEYPPLLDMDILLDALRGNVADATRLIDASERRATAHGLQWVVAFTAYARAVLNNGLGRHAVARDAARHCFVGDHAGCGPFLLSELAEAAARTSDVTLLESVLAWLGERTRATPTDWSLGIEARIQALLSNGSDTDALYRRSVEHLRRTTIRTELARTHLLYGEWLRRGQRRIDAREQLGLAHDMFQGMGLAGFAERARRESSATGASARRRGVESRDELTAQERQIAELARDGLSNPEIGAQLFLSPRTVEWHLRKVFSKLDISSRRELVAALPTGSSATVGQALASSLGTGNPW